MPIGVVGEERSSAFPVFPVLGGAALFIVGWTEFYGWFFEAATFSLFNLLFY